ncbi:PAS domain S-box protein [Phenylobacterium sp. J426]|uniref:ATP-binding protein n=1 Tax=Phenylobacterium sp. J426 TaxID=2898439 RepID=UPI002151251C|nr:ATP-binding protein [Phenylobacterium sp. J426]MCR5875060.1 PAS domain S-box protein [Phenylobacterium sp. J426]
MAAAIPSGSRTPLPALGGLLLLAASVAVLAYFGLTAPRDAHRVSPIWLANAPVLACLLRAPPRQWWIWLLAAFAGNMTADLLASHKPLISLGLSLCNGFEAAFCAALMLRMMGGRVDPSQPRHLVVSLAAASLAALTAAFLASAFLGLTDNSDFLLNLAMWAVADGLGLVILTPCIQVLIDRRRYLAERPVKPAGMLALLGVAATSVVVFSQDWPLIFLAPPAILLACLALELFGAAVATLVVSAVAVSFTFRDLGPLAQPQAGWTARLLVLQLFLLVNSGMAFQLAAVLRNRRRMREELEFARAEAEAQAAEALEAKAQYRQLAERVSDIMTRADVSGGITYLSPSVEAMTGYRPEEIVGANVFEQVHPEDRGEFAQAHLDMLSRRRAPGTPIRYRVRRKDGSWLWVEGNPSLVRDENGKPLEFVDVSRDITERVELELRLAQALDEAERAARVKSEFLANMSHEIRTPLTAIMGFASILDEMELDPPAGRYARKVTSASRTLLAIVNDVLDFSKLEAGLLEIKPRPTDPAECAADVLELFGPQAEAKGLRVELSTGARGLAMVDPDRLRQVLMNLAGNAVKFTQAGSVRVTVAWDAEERRLRCGVADTGPGLDETARAKLFQRFSQVDGSTARAHGGTGLGLAISKGLVEAMGGTIGVESQAGEGSLFWFEIPAPAAQASDAAPEEPPQPLALTGVRVLAADDNPQNLEILRSILTPLGVDLTEAGSGAQAVEIAKLSAFDLVLMDLRMPEVDGWAAAGAIREGGGPNRDTPILAFSADVAPDRREAMGVFQDLVRKPIEPLELVRAILTWSAPRVAADTVEPTRGDASAA